MRFGSATFPNNFYQQLSEHTPKQLSDKDFRRDWAQEQARQKLRDMRGQGLSDVRIGKKIGGSEPISGVFIGAVLRESDPKPVSKRVWDGLIENTDFKPVPPGSAVAPQQTEKVSHGPSPDLTAAVVRLEQQVAGLVSAQVMLLQRLDVVLRDRKEKRKGP